MMKIIFPFCAWIVCSTICPTFASTTHTVLNAQLRSQMDSSRMGLIELDINMKNEMMLMADKSDSHYMLASFFKNRKEYGYQNQILMKHSMKYDDVDSVYFYYKASSKNFIKGKDIDEQLYILQSEMVVWCIDNNHFELATNIGNSILHDYPAYNLQNILWAYLMLAKTYRVMGKPELAISTGQQGLSVTIDDKDKEWYLKTVIYAAIIDCYLEQKEYGESLKYCDLLLNWNQQIPKPLDSVSDLNSVVYNVTMHYVYVTQSKCYSLMGEHQKAWDRLQQSEIYYSQLITSNRFLNLYRVGRGLGFTLYYYSIGDFKKALAYLEETRPYIEITPHHTPEYKKFKKLEISILRDMGEYSKATDEAIELFQLSDSLNKMNSTKEISALWAVFEVDKAQHEKDYTQRRLHLIVISALIIIILASLLIIYFIIMNKKLKEKNNMLFQKLKKEGSERKFLPFVVKETTMIEETSVQIASDLYSQIVSYVGTTKAYTNPDITRESLASDLNTNRQYVIEAISNNTGMSFNEFINDFRLNYAQILLQSDESIQIKEAFLRAGFSNRNTFSRLFRIKFGMSPSEFKACVVEEAKMSNSSIHDNSK